MRDKPCEVKLHWYYVPDMYGVPDGKRKLHYATCSCCGENLRTYEVEQVDCGMAYHMECPHGCSGYTWYDLIEEC